MKTHTLGTGQFIEFILSRKWNEDDINCGNTNLNENMIVAVAIAYQPEKIGITTATIIYSFKFVFPQFTSSSFHGNIVHRDASHAGL